MRIFINAVALKVAGGKSVCINFLKSIESVGKGHEYYVFLPGGVGYEELKKKDYLKIKFIPHNLVGPAFRYYIDHIYLKKCIKRIHPDVIFSMGNIALPVTNIPQLLLFHIPFAVYPESVYWKRIGWRSRLHFKLVVREISRKLKYATIITVQTNCIKNRMGHLYDLNGRLNVIPNAVSLHAFQQKPGTFELVEKSEEGTREFKFLCLSRYYEHKNLEVFLPLAGLIKEKKFNYKIIITIDESQHRKAKKFLNEIQKSKLEDVIVNIGPVKTEEVPMAYCEADATILPTLLESFSGTYIEAAYYRKPIFTSDIDFAHEVCGPSAIYFDPLNPLDIFMKMQIIENSSFIDAMVKGAAQNLKRFHDWPEVTKMYLRELENVAAFDKH